MARSRRTIRSVAALVVAATLTAGVGRAAPGSWTQIGPDGGSVTAIVHDSTTSTTSYAVASSGIFKTTDGGTTWNRLGLDGLVQALAVSASNPATLYASAADSYVSSTGGIFKSIDGGANWTLVATAAVQTLAVDPTDASFVYAGTFSDGLLKTTDGGMTWNPSDTGITDTSGGTGAGVLAITIDRSTPSTLFATTCCSGTGVFKSTNAGATWTPSNTGLPPRGTGEQPEVVLDPTTSSTAYLVAYQQLFKSVDGGTSWSPTGAGLPTTVRKVGVDPTSPSVLYAGTYDGSAVDGGLSKSVDGGATFSPTGCGLHLVSDVEVRSDGSVFLATQVSNLHRRAGVYASTDGGASCALASHGITAFLAVANAVDSQNAGTVYMAAFGYGVFKTIDGGVTWTEQNAGLTGTGRRPFAIAVDPLTPSTVYLASGVQAGDGVWKSTDGTASWTQVLGSVPNITSLAVDPVDSQRLFVGSFTPPPPLPSPPPPFPTTIHRSVDGGATWSTTGLAVVFPTTIVVDPSAHQKVYVGTSNGVSRSTDGGATFPSGGAGLPPGGVGALAIDPADTTVLYAGTSSNGVYKSVDSGATWIPYNDGIATRQVTGVVVAPAVGGVFATVLLDGVYRRDAGDASWIPMNEGLHDLWVGAPSLDPTSPGRLFVGSESSSMFVRDFVACGCTPCETCDPVAGCVAAPDPSCTGTVRPARAKLQIRDLSGSSADRLVLRWRGDATSQPELGDPVATDDYLLCLYDESGPSRTTLVSASLPHGGTCGSRPCWTAVPAKGFEYANATGMPGGVTKLRIKPGLADAARTSLTARGGRLVLPPLPLGFPLRVQLRASNGLCQESVYSSTGVQRNDGRRFTGRAD